MTDPSIPVKRYLGTDISVAQAWCDAIHLWLIANNVGYAADVAVYNAGGPGGTARWCVPQLDTKPGAGPFDPPIVTGTNYYVTLKDRCLDGCPIDCASAVEWTSQGILLESNAAISIEGTQPADSVIIKPE